VSLLSKGLTRSVLLLCLGLLLAGQASGQDQNQSLDVRVARELMEAYELFGEEQFQESLTALNQIVADFPDMKPFDRATVLQIRGSVHVNLENLEAALDDFATALNLDALNQETQNQLRFNVAQLYFVTEQYEESVREFERWMATEGVEPTHASYFMLAAAYYNLDQPRESIAPIDRAIELAPEPEKRYYDLKNVVLSELEMTPERTRLMETMISIWPDQLSYWRQLASLYMDQGEDRKSFSTLEAAYLNGLIESEGDIVVLAQYYSSFNNPHRGAQMLEKEMDAGNVERSVENLELLSQLWSQAREHREAIPVLREAAQKAEDGNLYFRLGQALMASGITSRPKRRWRAPSTRVASTTTVKPTPGCCSEPRASTRPIRASGTSACWPTRPSRGPSRAQTRGNRRANGETTSARSTTPRPARRRSSRNSVNRSPRPPVTAWSPAAGRASWPGPN